MTRAVAFLAAALLAATIGAAQNAPSSSNTNGNANMPPSTSASDQNAANSTTGSPSGSVTVKGCLSGSALAEGSFKLTDKNGTVYNLTGDQAELTSNVGHEVSLTGEVSGSTTTSASGSNATSNQNPPAEKAPPTMRVTGLNKVSDHCQQVSTGPAAALTGSGPATLMRVSMQSTDSTGEPAAANGNLPTTATFLPLLGLLGLGSLVAGFLVRH